MNSIERRSFGGAFLQAPRSLWRADASFRRSRDFESPQASFAALADADDEIDTARHVDTDI